MIKLRGQGSLWAMFGLALLFFAVLSLALFQADQLKRQLLESPAGFVSNLMDVYLTIFDTGSGILLLLVSARLVGMEYSGGTIRILLARGGGRLRILLAKVAALYALGVLMLAAFTGLVIGSIWLAVRHWGLSTEVLTTLPAQVRTDVGINLEVAMLSMAVAILLGATAAVVGRSTAFAIGVAMAFYPADNLLTLLLNLVHSLTGWHVLLDISTVLLGPNLSVLPVLLQTDHRAHAAFAVPLVPVSSGHALAVVAAWSLALVIVSAVLTRRRDVLS